MTTTTEQIATLCKAFAEGFALLDQRDPSAALPSGTAAGWSGSRADTELGVGWPAKHGATHPDTKPFCDKATEAHLSAHAKVALAICARAANRAHSIVQEEIDAALGTNAAWTPQFSVSQHKNGMLCYQFYHQSSCIVSTSTRTAQDLMFRIDTVLQALRMVKAPANPRWWKWGNQQGFYMAGDEAQAYLLGAALFDPHTFHTTLTARKPRAKSTVFECFHGASFDASIAAFCKESRAPKRRKA